MPPVMHPAKKQPKIMGPKAAYLQYLREKYADNADIIITESFLQSSVQLPNTSLSNVTFGFQKNNNEVPVQTTDNRVDQSDTFEVYGWRFSLYTLPATTNASLVSTASVPLGIAQKQYFPNPNVFNGTVAYPNGLLEYQTLQEIYNGFLFVKIGATVFYEQFDMENFYNVGISQQGVAVSSVATTGVLPATSQVTNMLDVGVTPMFMLDGSAKNEITLNLYDNVPLYPSLTLSDVGMTRVNFVSLKLIGFKVQNGAKQPVNLRR